MRVHESLGHEDPLEEGVAIHSSIPAWKIPWIEEPCGLQSIGMQKVEHNWSDLAGTQTPNILLTPQLSSRVSKWLNLKQLLLRVKKKSLKARFKKLIKQKGNTLLMAVSLLHSTFLPLFCQLYVTLWSRFCKCVPTSPHWMIQSEALPYSYYCT